MSDNFLSQTEIDALLNDAPTDKTATSAAKTSTTEMDIYPYNPNTQQRAVRERLQSLEIINGVLLVNFVWDYLIFCGVVLTLP